MKKKILEIIDESIREAQKPKGKFRLDKTREYWELRTLNDIRMKVSRVDAEVKPEIADIYNDVMEYIGTHWNAKQITPEIGLQHWLEIQTISSLLYGIINKAK